jgi:hypothetical protein
MVAHLIIPVVIQTFYAESNIFSIKYNIYEMKDLKSLFLSLFSIILCSLFSCTYDSSSQEDTTQSKSDPSRYQPKEYVEVDHPEWSKNATIYEVNIRQYTPEGSFDAFEKHLPRLKQMGVDILWLMPIQPIGEKTVREHWAAITLLRIIMV